MACSCAKSTPLMSPIGEPLRKWNAIPPDGWQARKAPHIGHGNGATAMRLARSSTRSGSPRRMSDTQTADVDQLQEDGSIERLTIDTIRTLSMDAVQKAN